MGYKILLNKRLAPAVTRLDILAPDVVWAAKAGQFVVVIADENGERVPLTIAETDKSMGRITIIFQEVGFSTIRLGGMKAGDSVFAVLGPLGHPTNIDKFGTIICVAGGVGIAEILPVAAAFKNAGNKVIGIIGARSKELLILEDELKGVCEPLHVATDDGSKGVKGFVTDILSSELKTCDCALVYAVGPVAMMKKVAEVTKLKNIKTIVTLNPVMVDATGMCGVCRCRVDGKTVFGCVDGPEFDAHKVDFIELEKRLGFLRDEESRIKSTLNE